MADERKYFVICDDWCKFEGMTKEQILTAIIQAANDGEIKDVDSGFVTKLKEQNRNVGLSFWVGTQAEYNALTTEDNNCFYIITDDNTAEDMNAAIAELREQLENISTPLSNATEKINGIDTVLYTGDRIPYGDVSEKNIVLSTLHKYSIVKVGTVKGYVVCNVNWTENAIAVTGAGTGIGNTEDDIEGLFIYLNFEKVDGTETDYKLMTNKSSYAVGLGTATQITSDLSVANIKGII